MKKIILLVGLTLLMPAAFAQVDKDLAGGAERWNGTGPKWHATECGLPGFAFGVGVGEDKWVKPCSIPVRVCEFKTVTVNVVALPDPGPECLVINPLPTGGLVRTELRTWK